MSRRGLRVAGVTAALALLATACPRADHTSFVIRNDTTERLEIRLLGRDEVVSAQANNTGGFSAPSNGCRPQATGMVAIDPDGDEVARLDLQPCAGDEWIIHPDHTTTLIRHGPEGSRRGTPDHLQPQS